MKAKELAKILLENPECEVKFRFTDGETGGFLNVRDFEITGDNDIGHSDKIIALFGKEEE